MDMGLFDHHATLTINRDDEREEEWEHVLLKFFLERIAADLRIEIGKSSHFIVISDVDEERKRIKYESSGLPEPVWMDIRHIDGAQAI